MSVLPSSCPMLELLDVTRPDFRPLAEVVSSVDWLWALGADRPNTTTSFDFRILVLRSFQCFRLLRSHWNRRGSDFSTISMTRSFE